MGWPPKRTVLHPAEDKVGIVIKLRAGRSRKFYSILGGEKRRFSTPYRPKWLWDPQIHTFRRYLGCFLWGKGTGTQSWRLTPSSAEVRNVWSLTLLSLMFLDNVAYRDVPLLKNVQNCSVIVSYSL